MDGRGSNFRCSLVAGFSRCSLCCNLGFVCWLLRWLGVVLVGGMSQRTWVRLWLGEGARGRCVFVSDLRKPEASGGYFWHLWLILVAEDLTEHC